MKRALVTGGATGLGRAIASALVEAGVETVILGRRADVTQATARAIGATALVGDVTADTAALIAEAGPLSYLVNNAGHSARELVGDFDAETFASLYAVHLTAPAMLAQAFAAQSADLQPEAIVNISSTLAHQSVPGTAAYTAAKAGLLALTRVLAAELAPKIRVNAISPGVVRTEMTADYDLDALARVHPLGLGRPADVAAATLYLLTAPWITGTELCVDGGLRLS